MNVRQAKYKIEYNARDITRDITPFLLGLTYVDHVKDKTDSIEVTVEDTDLIWQNEWYPTKGDQLTVSIGYDDQLLPCGTFDIDEIEVSGLPDQISIRGIAAGITKSLRTRRSYAYEKQTLRKIAQTIAGRHGLTIQGTIKDISIERKTQNRETDLYFLSRVANEYGYIFSIRDKQLTFTEVYDLEALESVQSIDRVDLMSYSLKDKTSMTYKKAQVKYHNPNNQKLITGEYIGTDSDTSEDDLEIWVKAESNGQANAIARSALHFANTRKVDGSITIEGNPYLVAGNNFELTGMGVLSGIYHIESSTHSIDSGIGYTTTIEIKRIGTVDRSKWKPREARKQAFNFVT